MVHFTKDGFVITVSALNPFCDYQTLQKGLADVMTLVFANRDSIPSNEPIYCLADFMSTLSEIEQKQSYEIDKLVQKL
ncbi:hypothetical protein VB796_13540 [Arcicella sp. LKC2W]|uniref:hypothetical protein n=1 Tax=Arcicella sp. LKC2W TaxID=2984198 RepID=UPI002B20D229|nr:hypothetical protein [Arcicella sp. LKC2W]MEA5460073.1 hypothetical protein [Arcicella sp. LKC2W]